MVMCEVGTAPNQHLTLGDVDVGLNFTSPNEQPSWGGQGGLQYLGTAQPALGLCLRDSSKLQTSARDRLKPWL